MKKIPISHRIELEEKLRQMRPIIRILENQNHILTHDFPLNYMEKYGKKQYNLLVDMKDLLQRAISKSNKLRAQWERDVHKLL